MLFASTKVIAYLVVIGRVPFLTNLVMRLVPRSLKEQADEHLDLSKQKTLRRMEMKDSHRVDFMTRILKDNDKNDLRTEELFGNSSTLIVAGSETTATFLSGATYFLAKFPAVMEKLVNELHSSFAEEMDINMVDLGRLKYLNAVIEESFRMYPPVPIGMPRRVVLDQGASIGGYLVPKNTAVAVHQWAANTSASNFTLPNSFIPGRWLDDSRFASDKRDAMQPFSVGPRNCIGRNLAYAEIRTILARMVYRYDISLLEESLNWVDGQQVWILWEKPSLMVKLTPRAKI